MVASPVAPREASTVSLVDTHVHLTDRRYARDLDDVLERAREAGVWHLVVVGYDLPSSEAAVALAARKEGLWAAVGIHPHNATEADPAALRALASLAAAPHVLAIGECGLDYYRDLAPRPVQRRAFAAQLELARQLGLPVVIHSRDALPDTLRLVAAQAAVPAGAFPTTPARAGHPGATRAADGAGTWAVAEAVAEAVARDGAGAVAGAVAGVLHCFDGDMAQALEAVRLGLHVSCAGPLTYRQDRMLATALAAVPADRLVLETDAPYLAPAGHRGERNEPAHVRLVAEALAKVRRQPVEAIARLTSANAARLFRTPALAGAPGEQVAG